MAYNQFLTAELKGTTLEVTGRTPDPPEDGPPATLFEITVAVGTLEEDGLLPEAGADLPHHILAQRQLNSPWTAFFADLPPGFERGKPIIVIGAARGEFPGGPVEIWYEKVEIE